LDWIGLGQDFQVTLWIGLDWVSKNGPMSNSVMSSINIYLLIPGRTYSVYDFADTLKLCHIFWIRKCSSIICARM